MRRTVGTPSGIRDFSLLALVFLLATMLVQPHIARAAATLFVAPTGNDSNSCLTAASACHTIAAAMIKATSGDSISIAAGTYTENLTVTKELAFSGAGPNATIIDGRSTGTVITIGRVNTTITGVTVQNGNAGGRGGGIINDGTLALANSAVTNNTSASNGGGIANTGTLTLTNSFVTNNRALDTIRGWAGGIQNFGSNGQLTLINSTVSGNTAFVYGGGIGNIGGTMTLIDSVVSNNTTTGAGFGGGGIFNNQTMTLNRSNISGNRATGNGGGIRNNGTAVLDNSSISGNAASENGGGIYSIGASNTMTLRNIAISQNHADRYGGGISNSGIMTVTATTISSNTSGGGAGGGGGGVINSGRLTLSRSNVSGNQAANDGGGIFNFSALQIDSSTISANTTSNYAGGIYNANSGTSALTGTTISDNRANIGGGGLLNGSGPLTLINSTVSNNRATSSGGGFYNFGTLTLTNVTTYRNEAGGAGGGLLTITGTVRLQNSILAGNPSPVISPDCAGAVTSLGDNLLGNATGCSYAAAAGDHVGSNGAAIDPHLSPLRDNGGPTFTHALLIGSPALDAASQGPCPAVDQRGVARPQGVACDIGAFEASSVVASDPAPRIRLVFAQQPSASLEGQPFPTQPVVVAYDQFGNFANLSGQVTLELKNNAGIPGATLDGPKIVSAVNGVATFGGLSISKAGTGYQLIATATGLISATSMLVNISAPPRPRGQPLPEEVEVNDTTEQANPLVFSVNGRATITGRIAAPLGDKPDVDVFSFFSVPGADGTINLSGLPADYDVLIFADPRFTLPISDDIDLSNIADLPRGSLPRGSLPRGSLSGIASTAGTADETMKVFLPQGGQYFVIVYGADDRQYNDQKLYRLDIALNNGALLQPAFRAHTISALNAQPDSSVRTIFLYNSARMRARYAIQEELAAIDALNTAFNGDNSLMQEQRDDQGRVVKDKAAVIDLGAIPTASAAASLRATLTLTDSIDLTALYNQWDGAPPQPLLSNEVAQQLWYVLDYALTQVYTGTTSIVLVGGDDLLPFYRVPDETDLANESDYYYDLTRDSPQATGVLSTETALAGSLYHSFIQTDNFYADRKPTPWRGRALYLPDLGIGRLVERPTDIMHYLSSYLASDKYTIDAQQSGSANAGVLVTGYSYLVDQADAITSILSTYNIGLKGTVPLTTTIGDNWDEAQFENVFFSGQLPQLTGNYLGPYTRYYLASLNGHFSHFEAAPAQDDTSAFSAVRLLAPTVSPGNDRAAYFKIDGAPTLIYSIGCHSGLSAPDSAFSTAETQADFPQAVLKQGGNWIGNTGYGYADTELIGYSERLSLKFTEALGRYERDGNGDGVGREIGDAMARAKREYLLTNGSSTLTVFDEKILVGMTLYGLPFIRVKVPMFYAPPSHPQIAEWVWANLQDANGVFTRLVTVTNSFTVTTLASGDSIPRATGLISDSFRPGATLEPLHSVDQMAQARPVLPLLTYDLTLRVNDGRSESEQPIPRGVRLLSAETLGDVPFQPHVTATISDQTTLERPGRSQLAYHNQWTPDRPYIYQLAAEQLSATQTITAAQLLITPTQFKATGALSGKLRQFRQMVFEVTYVNPRRAPPAILAKRSNPVFGRVRITSAVQRGGKTGVRFVATLDRLTNETHQMVSVTYTTDGVTWQRASLERSRDSRYIFTLPVRPREISAFFEVLDKAGNVTVLFVNRRFKHPPPPPDHLLWADNPAQIGNQDDWVDADTHEATLVLDDEEPPDEVGEDGLKP